MRLSKVAALALVVGATGFMSVSLALAASDCPTLAELADWGENSTGDISVASGESCLFPIRMRGTVSSSDISQKPVHGKLKRLNKTRAWLRNGDADGPQSSESREQTALQLRAKR
jgi:hypothetical protein